MLQDKEVKKYLGGKAGVIMELNKWGYSIPQTSILGTGYFIKFLEVNNLMNEIVQLCKSMDKDNFELVSQKIRMKIINGRIDGESLELIKKKIAEINYGLLVIRSSSVNEDSHSNSFAGMHDSYLNIPNEIEIVIEYIKKCWASLFNDRAVAYKLYRNIGIFDKMAVILQEMIEAQYSGVVYTVHPIFSDCILMEMLPGLGSNLVEGKINPYRYIINKKNFSIKNIKQQKIIVDRKILTDTVKKCSEMERIFGCPQDIEFCVNKEMVYFLQSRPLNLPDKAVVIS